MATANSVSERRRRTNSAYYQRRRTAAIQAELQVALEERRDRDRRRRATEVSVTRQERLDRVREGYRQRISNEGGVTRQNRLQQRRERDAARRATESDDARRARLQQRRERDAARRATESNDARQARLQQRRERDAARRCTDHSNRSDRQCPLMPTLDEQRVKETLAQFHAVINSYEVGHCITCNEAFPGLVISASSCSQDSKESKLYSAANNMDPGPVPPVLQNLTQVEEMLISRIMPIMNVYRLHHGQYGYAGHVVNLPQDVGAFASSLPRDCTQLDSCCEEGRNFRFAQRLQSKAVLCSGSIAVADFP